MSNDQAQKELTDTQRKVVNFISEFIARECYPPSLREIATEFGWSSTNGVKCHLIALGKKGFIEWEPNKARTIRILKNE